MSPQEMKKFAQDAIKGPEEQWEKFECRFCLLIAYEPLLCKKCQISVSCKECYSQWKRQNQNNSSCINCQDKSEPQPLEGFSLKIRNSYKVSCQNQQCDQKDKLISYQDYLDHKCIQKLVRCPLSCGNQFLQQDSDAHFMSCPEIILQCKTCDGKNSLSNIYSHNCIDVLKNTINFQKFIINNLEQQLENQKNPIYGQNNAQNRSSISVQKNYPPYNFNNGLQKLIQMPLFDLQNVNNRQNVQQQKEIQETAWDCTKCKTMNLLRNGALCSNQKCKFDIQMNDNQSFYSISKKEADKRDIKNKITNF